MDSPEALTSEAPKTVPADPATTSGRKLDRSLVHSLAWRAAGDWASQIFSWGSLLIIVRLLVPSDFGMVAMAVIFFPFLRQISEFGIPRIIVTFRDLSDEHIAELNTVGALLGGFCFLLACAAANEHSRPPTPGQAVGETKICGTRQSWDSLRACLKNGSSRRESS